MQYRVLYILHMHMLSCAYLRVGIWIPEQYYIYCSPIPMLQTGISFVALRVGRKKCSTVNHAYLARAARRRLALDELYQRNAT